MERKLTEQQAKMVIEYFAQQAAEDAPADGSSWKAWDTHMWMTLYRTALAVERVLSPDAWEDLIEAQMDLQSFDRDADLFIADNGYDPSTNKDKMRDNLLVEVSWRIDTVYRNSKAA